MRGRENRVSAHTLFDSSVGKQCVHCCKHVFELPHNSSASLQHFINKRREGRGRNNWRGRGERDKEKEREGGYLVLIDQFEGDVGPSGGHQRIFF